MKSWSQFLVEKTEHEFSSTQVQVPQHIAKQILEWSKKNIPDSELAEDGREDNIHVTVLFGLHTNESGPVKAVLTGEKPVTFELGEISLFQSERHDVVKFSVHSPDLERLNKKLRDECEYTSNFPKYVPHCTIAYVRSGTGKKYAGNKDFAGTKVTVDEVLFSDKLRDKTPIKLTGKDS